MKDSLIIQLLSFGGVGDMMISFWSPVKDEYVSSIAVLTAMAGCDEFSCKVVLSDNYVGKDNIGFSLFGASYIRLRKEYERYQLGYYEQGDSFLKFLRKETGKAVYQGRSLEIIREQMYFLPLNQSLRPDIYEYLFDRELPDLRDYCESKYDFFFLNLADSGNLSTKTALEYANQVVICMPASEWALELLMERYSALLPKALIVFHGEPDSNFLRRMRRRYPAFRERMMFLPVTKEWKEVVREGRVLDFGSEGTNRGCLERSRAVFQKLRYLAFSVMRKEKNDRLLRYEDMKALFTERNSDPYKKQYSLPTGCSYVAERETV